MIVHSLDQLEVVRAVLGAQASGGEVVIAPWRGGTKLRDEVTAGLAGLPPRPGAIVLASSGTTGRPRTQASSIDIRRAAMLLGLIGTLPIPPRPHVMCLTRVDSGHGFTLWAATMAVGGTFHAAGSPTVEVDLLSGVPAQLLDASVRAPIVLSGSDVLTPDASRRIADRTGGRVVDAYGATEIGTVALDGVLMPGVTARQRPDGVICITSPFATEPFIGDRGHIAGGRLHITGRADAALASHGETLDPDRLQRWLDDRGVRATVGVLDTGSGLRFTLTTTDPHCDTRTLSSAITDELGHAYRPATITGPG